MGAPEKALFETRLTDYFNNGHHFQRPPKPPERNVIKPLDRILQAIPAAPPPPPGVTHVILTFTLQPDGTYVCTSA